MSAHRPVSGGGVRRLPSGPVIPPLPQVVSDLREDFLLLLQSLEADHSFTSNVYIIDVLLTLAHLDVHLREEERQIFVRAYNSITSHLLAKVESMKKMVAKVVYAQLLVESLEASCEVVEKWIHARDVSRRENGAHSSVEASDTSVETVSTSSTELSPDNSTFSSLEVDLTNKFSRLNAEWEKKETESKLIAALASLNSDSLWISSSADLSLLTDLLMAGGASGSAGVSRRRARFTGSFSPTRHPTPMSLPMPSDVGGAAAEDDERNEKKRGETTDGLLNSPVHEIHSGFWSSVPLTFDLLVQVLSSETKSQFDEALKQKVNESTQESSLAPIDPASEDGANPLGDGAAATGRDREPRKLSRGETPFPTCFHPEAKLTAASTPLGANHNGVFLPLEAKCDLPSATPHGAHSKNERSSAINPGAGALAYYLPQLKITDVYDHLRIYFPSLRRSYSRERSRLRRSRHIICHCFDGCLPQQCGAEGAKIPTACSSLESPFSVPQSIQHLSVTGSQVADSYSIMRGAAEEEDDDTPLFFLELDSGLTPAERLRAWWRSEDEEDRDEDCLDSGDSYPVSSRVGGGASNITGINSDEKTRQRKRDFDISDLVLHTLLLALQERSAAAKGEEEEEEEEEESAPDSQVKLTFSTLLHPEKKQRRLAKGKGMNVPHDHFSLCSSASSYSHHLPQGAGAPDIKAGGTSCSVNDDEATGRGVHAQCVPQHCLSGLPDEPCDCCSSQQRSGGQAHEPLSLLCTLRGQLKEMSAKLREGLTPLYHMQQQLRGEIALLTYRVISTIVDWLIPGISDIERSTWIFYRSWLCDLYAHLYSLDLLPLFQKMMHVGATKGYSSANSSRQMNDDSPSRSAEVSGDSSSISTPLTPVKDPSSKTKYERGASQLTGVAKVGNRNAWEGTSTPSSRRRQFPGASASSSSGSQPRSSDAGSPLLTHKKNTRAKLEENLTSSQGSRNQLQKSGRQKEDAGALRRKRGGTPGGVSSFSSVSLSRNLSPGNGTKSLNGRQGTTPGVSLISDTEKRKKKPCGENKDAKKDAESQQQAEGERRPSPLRVQDLVVPGCNVIFSAFRLFGATNEQNEETSVSHVYGKGAGNGNLLLHGSSSTTDEPIRIAMALLDTSSIGFTVNSADMSGTARAREKMKSNSARSITKEQRDDSSISNETNASVGTANNKFMMTRLMAAAVRGLDQEAVSTLAAAFASSDGPHSSLPKPVPEDEVAPLRPAAGRRGVSFPDAASTSMEQQHDQHYHAFHYPAVSNARDIIVLYRHTLRDAETILNPHDPLRASLVLHASRFLVSFSSDLAPFYREQATEEGDNDPLSSWSPVSTASNDDDAGTRSSHNTEGTKAAFLSSPRMTAGRDSAVANALILIEEYLADVGEDAVVDPVHQVVNVASILNPISRSRALNSETRNPQSQKNAFISIKKLAAHEGGGSAFSVTDARGPFPVPDEALTGTDSAGEGVPSASPRHTTSLTPPQAVSESNSLVPLLTVIPSWKDAHAYREFMSALGELQEYASYLRRCFLARGHQQANAAPLSEGAATELTPPHA